jgi:hypothetical protein
LATQLEKPIVKIELGKPARRIPGEYLMTSEQTSHTHVATPLYFRFQSAEY